MTEAQRMAEMAYLDELLAERDALRAKGQALADAGAKLYEYGYDLKEWCERDWEAALDAWDQT